jgi:VanZ family protein
MKKLIWRWLPVFVWLIVIFIGSSIGSMPRVGGKAVDAIVHRIAHVIEYAVLGGLLLRATSERGSITWRQVIGVALLCALYGVTDEWHQAYVPGRSSELSAIPFDLGGGLIGAVVWWGRIKLTKPQVSE